MKYILAAILGVASYFAGVAVERERTSAVLTKTLADYDAMLDRQKTQSREMDRALGQLDLLKAIIENRKVEKSEARK